MAESLMLAMDGETETPPILRAAFARQPLAQAGWNAMTPIQRRNHLFGIFFQQTVQGRERRAAGAVEECLRVARRKCGE
ncbi:MAG TPA: YdeI/OmpD-associated family protein [Terracidiphilus sp.]|nr:YdeI/OmpD-associated family protein [Terracidiphilus sp.]